MLHKQVRMGRGRVLRRMLLPVLLGGVVFAILVVGGQGFGEAHIADTGVVQGATLATLLFATTTALFLAWRHPDNRFNLALLACGLAIYAGREHDLHRLGFLAENYTKWQFYTMATVPPWQKVCFGAVMIFIIGTVSLFAMRMVQQTINDLKRGEPWTLFGVIWLTTLTASQIADHSWLNETYFGRAFEETAELIAAMFAVLVVWHFPRQPAKSRSPSQAIPGDIPRETARANAS